MLLIYLTATPLTILFSSSSSFSFFPFLISRVSSSSIPKLLRSILLSLRSQIILIPSIRLQFLDFSTFCRYYRSLAESIFVAVRVKKKRVQMSKYGLNLRPAKGKKQPPRPSIPLPFGFNEDDDNDVEKEIAIQASKTKRLKDVEEQQKKALEEDPTIFDYDGVYDKMKEKVARPLIQDREERKPKYIQNLIQKAKEREQYREIVYEKKIAKERSKDDHLFADKDKYITEAYRKKLAEREKQMELERLRELQEEREDVTKKKDFLLDFYTNLDKNVAYGANDAQRRKHDNRAENRVPKTNEGTGPDASNQHQDDNTDEEQAKVSSPAETSGKKIGDEGETSNRSNRSSSPLDMKPKLAALSEEKSTVEGPPSTSQPNPEHHKRSQDAVAAAKERFLARKRAKDQ